MNRTSSLAVLMNHAQTQEEEVTSVGTAGIAH